MNAKSDTHLRVGIDVGGTFTDFVIYNLNHKQFYTFKLPTTPADPSIAVIEGINNIIRENYPCKLSIVHGTTVATNAVIERKGAKTALLTTSGFKYILQ